ncbi:hypothetical protein D918_04265 [Trichuris suis]|nr:hypothetical protein D918_04265 [Trichuris suis]
MDNLSNQFESNQSDTASSSTEEEEEVLETLEDYSIASIGPNRPATNLQGKSLLPSEPKNSLDRQCLSQPANQ